MCQNEKSRSKLMIDAVVQATAPGPLNKLTAIAGLAGFVLRLFRSRVTGPCRPQQGSGHRSATVRPGTRAPGAQGKGGLRHG